MTAKGSSELEYGLPFPLGATVRDGGVNFAVFAEHASRIELCLFDVASAAETERLALPDRTGGVWHGFLHGAAAGQLYGFRAYGPYGPDAGHRYNPHRLLLDPYAREIVGRYRTVDEHFGYQRDHPDGHRSFHARDNAAVALKCRVALPLPASTVPPPHRLAADTIIYELHVRGFTRLHPDVPPALRGTYAGLAHPAVVDHLSRLGVTALSLLPVQYRLDEARLGERGLVNFWGYNTIGFFCPDPRLSSTPEDPSATRAEFRAMVEALHAAGIEVLLDVVYNHTAEGNENGPTLCFRGLDNASYYRLWPDDPARYEDFTGCGNTLNVEHPRVTQLVLDSLRYWVGEMGVDGFRFDLASVLGRTAQGFDERAAFFTVLLQDPVLARAKLVAEPWDVGPHGYQLGHFPERFLEWNDRFRDGMRLFWLSRGVGRGEFARRLMASSDKFHHGLRLPCASTNFIAAHDGFTLHDLVSYSHKHNQANGEHNRDGHHANFSINCGAEGPTSSPAIAAQRARLKRALLATALFAQGTPMLLAGDELGRTQRGNNNAYCQDNETSWVDWAHADLGLVEFVRSLIALRRCHRALQLNFWLTDDGAVQAPSEVRWLAPEGHTMTIDDWHDSGRHCLGVQLAPVGEPPVLLLFNAESAPVEFVLPSGIWHVHLESSAPFLGPAPAAAGATIGLPANSVMLLVGHQVTGTAEAAT
jgi:glycogen operon protein